MADARTVEAWLKGLPGADELLFWPPPASLYTVARLYHGLTLDVPASWREAWDTKVWRWTLGRDGRPRPLDASETVATRLHDAAMDRLVRDYIDPGRSVTVGFMGGHDIPRADPAFARVALLARALRRRGFKIVTGGGPGLMEAANFGAFMAPHADADLDRALETLRAAPSFDGDHDKAVAERHKQAWISSAARVRQSQLGRWDAEPREGGDSLGIPTWYYGSEPPNLFASVSGKYFMNSLREDGLVSIANGGLVFAKGAAGTVQEVFQNASYNYYRGAGVGATPMVFLGADFWNPCPPADATADAPLDPRRKPVFPLIAKLAADADPTFSPGVLLSDDAGEIAEFLVSHNRARAGDRQADARLARVNSLPAPCRL
ncbi:MAG: hypothetical protein ACREEB_08800 [Caulobacteraceae bacterium]